MPRRRIVLVTPGFPVVREEPGLPAIVELVERLAIDHDVEVVALRHPPARSPYELAGARIVPLGAGRAGGAAGRARVLARGVAAVLAIHRRRRIDLVHGLWADEAGAVAVTAARLIRRPSVVSVLGGELVALPGIGYGAALGRGGRLTAALSLRLADVVTAGSGAVERAILDRRPGARVARLPLGVDTGRFRPRQAPDDPEEGRLRPEAILFVGSLEPVKDPATAVRVLARLATSRPVLRLDVVGEGRLRPDLETLAARLGVGERVRFHGQLDRHVLRERYRHAGLLLVTSRHEGQSMVAVEAAASGLPVVGTRVGVLPDLDDGAITVPVGDEDGLVAAAARVLDDRELADRMAAAGRAVAVERFDIRRTVADLAAAYRSLLG